MWAKGIHELIELSYTSDAQLIELSYTSDAHRIDQHAVSGIGLMLK